MAAGSGTIPGARRGAPGAMSQVDLVCAVIRWPVFHWLMVAMGWLGGGWVATGLGTAVVAWGLLSRDERRVRAGVAALAALLLAGLLANGLKLAVPSVRPLGGSYGFPSGHSSSAFALAGALGYAWPAAAPWLGLAGVLAGAARVYFRAHFLNDVFAGGALGLLCGMLAARCLVGAQRARRGAAWQGWATASALALGVLALVASYERDLGASRGRPAAGAPALTLAFGTPEARSRLAEGWSADETWNDGTPMVWGQGPESALALPGVPVRPYQLRLRVAPFARPRRAVCQRMTVAVNGEVLARVALERGWWDYLIPVPARALRPEGNELRLRFAHTEQPGATGTIVDLRPLTAAFAQLDLVPAGP